MGTIDSKLATDPGVAPVQAGSAALRELVAAIAAGT